MALTAADRPRLLIRALRLEYLTVGWNIVEGLVAIAAGLAAGSVALVGYGIDSFVESASGSVLVWRLLAERRADEDDQERIEHVERRAQKRPEADEKGHDPVRDGKAEERRPEREEG